VLHDISEKVVDHIHVMAGLGIEHAPVQFPRAVPINLEIVVVAIPQHVANELVDFAQAAAVDQFLRKGHQRIVAVLVDRQQDLAGLIDAGKQLIGLPQRQGNRFLAEDVRGIRAFGDFGGMLRVVPGRRQDGGHVNTPDPMVVGDIWHPEALRCLARLGLVRVADQRDFQVRGSADGFNVAVQDAATANQCDFLHLIPLLSTDVADKRPVGFTPKRFSGPG